MKEDKIGDLLEDLLTSSQSDYNRYIMSMISHEEYTDRRKSLIEDAIRQITNLDVIYEINNLKRKLR